MLIACIFFKKAFQSLVPHFIKKEKKHQKTANQQNNSSLLAAHKDTLRNRVDNQSCFLNKLGCLLITV